MATEIGSIDPHGRTLVRVSSTTGDAGQLALLDTGFNGELMCDLSVAARLGVALEREAQVVVLAGGVRQSVQVGSVRIAWLGRSILARVFVSPATVKAQRDGDPALLLGTGLLKPHLVLLDFSEMTIEIEEQ